MSMSSSAPSPPASALRLESDGAALVEGAVSAPDLAALRVWADAILCGGSGVRVFADAIPGDVLAATGALGRQAAAMLGPAALPVRAVMFDKTAATNWAVGWHQDRTIAVRARRDAPGFGPWTIKAGVPHVEPPFEILAGMITLRLHLDDCDADNAPLLVAPGSHRLGRVAAAEVAAMAGRLGLATCLAAAGDLWIYATPILHASERTRKPGRRRVLQVDYASRGLPDGLEWAGVSGVTVA